MKTPAYLILLLVVTLAAIATATRAPNESPRFVAHEWGTFTTVAGSDGVLLPGLEREEEALPYWVYSHAGMGPLGRKGFLTQRAIHNATVKLETPVLYFYHDDPLDLEVNVGFRGGSISQWYPQRSGGETPPPIAYDEKAKTWTGGIDFGADPYPGAIQWKVRSHGRGQASHASVLKFGETLNWIRPRWPDSNIVETEQGEFEKYLFYRGVGNFSLPLTTTVNPEGELAMTSSTGIPFALVYHMTDESLTKVLWQGPIESERRIDGIAVNDTAGPDEGYAPLQENAAPIFESLKSALVADGLTPVEADSMLRTWWRAYFGKPGLRVFWIVPRSLTDRVLPIDISPAPDELARVLIGRSEVLTPAFEAKLATAFALPYEENPYRNHLLQKTYRARVLPSPQ